MFTLFLIPKKIIAVEFLWKENPLKSNYIDEELNGLYKSLDDFYNPSIDDFIKIQNYLKYGKRLYLDVLFEALVKKEGMTKICRSDFIYKRVLQKINFTDNEKSIPNLQKKVFGASVNDKSKCIVLYGTFNFCENYAYPNISYAQKVLDYLDELESIGYTGHVLYHLGGWPLLNRGSMNFIHIPYSFKILSLMEAFFLGYKNVLWVDITMHPTNNLDAIFQKIEKEGRLLLFNGINLDYDLNYPEVTILPDIAIRASRLTAEQLVQIPHVIAAIVGVSFEHQLTQQFIEEWYRLTSLTIPAMTLYPEEFLISVSSWRTHNTPNGNVWDYFDVRSVVKTKPIGGKKPFWFDKS